MFKREDRYLVFKRSDMNKYLSRSVIEDLLQIADLVEQGRNADGKPGLRCVVVEDDWPEYEKVWKMIEERVEGRNLSASGTLISQQANVCDPQSELDQYGWNTISTVAGVLNQAIEEVGGRANLYDSPQGEESMPKIVELFNRLYGKDLTVEQGWQFMTILKMVRSAAGGFKRDNYVDQAAYSAFACKAAKDERG